MCSTVQQNSFEIAPKSLKHYFTQINHVVICFCGKSSHRCACYCKTRREVCLYENTYRTCIMCVCSCNLLHKCCRHLIAVFPHTLWLAPLTAFGNVCLQSLASLHLEHAPEELPDLCAIRLVVISCASALLGPMCMVQLSVLCHYEAKAVISALDSLAITAVHFPNSHWLLTKQTFSVFCLLFIPWSLSQFIQFSYIDYLSLMFGQPSIM